MMPSSCAASERGRMKVGVFDHLDRNDRPLHAFYEERLKIVEAYDRGGFYAYHTAEHHATPLGLAASAHAAPALRSTGLYRSTICCGWRRRFACSTSSAQGASSSASAAASRRSRPPITGSTPTTDRRCISKRCRSCARL